MKDKIRVGVLFGGQSAEHEVSFQSALSIIRQINREKYEVIPVGIDRAGNWHFLTVSQFFLLSQKKSFPTFREKDLNSPFFGFFPSALRKNLDVIFPALHGPYGEDGTLQGLARLANLPCVGSDVLGSAICMDKGILKSLLREAKFPISNFLSLGAHDSICFEACIRQIGLPLFVKPANLGSSIGIRKVYRKEELMSAVKNAFLYDEKILIEECILGREIECSVLGNLNPIASLPGEIVPKEEFYSYRAKYLNREGALFYLPSRVDAKKIREIQELAIRSFKVLQCEGMARVDFFLKKDGTLLINELNTIPGFTNVSLYPKLWELSGISYPELIDRLIQLALERHERRSRLKVHQINTT